MHLDQREVAQTNGSGAGKGSKGESLLLKDLSLDARGSEKTFEVYHFFCRKQAKRTCESPKILIGLLGQLGR